MRGAEIHAAAGLEMEHARLAEKHAGLETEHSILDAKEKAPD